MHAGDLEGLLGGGGVAAVGHVLLLAHVHVDVAGAGVPADDHAVVHLHARLDEQLAAVLDVEQGVGGGHAVLPGHQRAGVAGGDVALDGLVVLEHGAHDALAAGVGEELAAIAEQAAGRHDELQPHAALAIHGDERAAATADLVDHRAGELGGHVAHQPLHGLALLAIDVLVQHHRLGHGELIALAAHGLDEDGQVQLAAPVHPEGVGALRLLHAQADVGQCLLLQTRAQVAGGDIGALGAGEGAVVDAEGHGDGGLVDLHEGQRLGHGRRADGVADQQVREAGHGHDVAHLGALGVHPLQSVELEQARQPRRGGDEGGVVDAADSHLAGVDAAALDAAHADAAHVVVVVDGGDQQLQRAFRVALGRRDVRKDCVEQGPQVGAGLAPVGAGCAGAAGGVDDGAVQLLVAGVQVDQQLQRLVHHLVTPRVGPVGLVHHDDDLQIQLQRLLQHEAGLGHGALEAVHQQKHAGDHLQHALHLAGEVRVAGGVHDVDLHAVVVHGGVLGQDRDAALALQVVGVHHAVLDLLVLAEHASLLQHFVHQRGLAVVDVGDDGDVAKIVASNIQCGYLFSVYRVRDVHLIRGHAVNGIMWGQALRTIRRLSRSPSRFSMIS